MDIINVQNAIVFVTEIVVKENRQTMAVKRIKKVIKGLKKASRSHASQARTLTSVIRKRKK
tara:strand:+ start:1908 stop:2090 length:183 start_codon:yes stop_codon:yes gene_type:complete